VRLALGLFVLNTLFYLQEEALVRGKWRRLIRGTVEDSDDSGGLMYLVPAQPGYSGLKGRKTVAVVAAVLFAISTR